MSPPYLVHQGYLPARRGDLLVHVHEQLAPAPVVLITSALGVSCTEPRYLMTLLARKLASGGATVVQYDHPADGDSTGQPAETGAADLLAAGRLMLDLAVRLSSGPVALVGYGAGNIVASSLLTHAAVRSAVLIAPCFRAWDLDWLAACPPSDQSGLIAAPVTPDGTSLGDIWRAIYGEPVVLSQPPGPVSARLVAELAQDSPGPAVAERRESVLVVSDLDTDIGGWTGPSLRLTHEATPAQPSWHWNHAARTAVIDAVEGWTHQRWADAAPGEQLARRSRDEIPAPAGGPLLRAETGDGTAVARAVQVRGDTVFGILRRPGTRTARPGLCVIYEPGNPGQRVDIHRCGPVLADRLADRGLASFRYDPRGMGTSLGDYQDMTWSGRLADLTAVMYSLEAEGFRSFVLVGNSAGARVGVRAARTDRRVAGLVLWDPVLRDEADAAAPELIRVKGGLATEWCGLSLGLRYQRDEREYDYLAAFAGSDTPTCVVLADGEPDQSAVRAMLATADGGVTVHRVAGTHGFSWLGLLKAIELSAQWIEMTLLEEAAR